MANPSRLHKVIVIWFWVGLPRVVIPSIDILYISDPKGHGKVISRSQKSKWSSKKAKWPADNRDGHNFEIFCFSKLPNICFSAYILQVYMKPDNINCSLVNYFTVLYISSKYKKYLKLLNNQNWKWLLVPNNQIPWNNLCKFTNRCEHSHKI